jgi:cyclopropane fatty-acyl-phospholipid synthase-like methyltransferase
LKKWFYEIVYRLVPADLVFGSTAKIEKFVHLAINGRIAPGNAITLGCGVGRETIYLAKQGFDVTGLDFSPTAIKKARRKARAAGVDVTFIVDDLTKLSHPLGTFDLVMDFGALNDLSRDGRDQYIENVLPLTRPGGHYVMFCFDGMLPEKEVRQRFEESFCIEVLDQRGGGRFPGTLTLYSMTRQSGGG